MLSTLRALRDNLYAFKFKLAADEAERLLTCVLDEGVYWQTWVPAVHEFVAEAERLLSDIKHLPPPTLRRID